MFDDFVRAHILITEMSIFGISQITFSFYILALNYAIPSDSKDKGGIVWELVGV